MRTVKLVTGATGGLGLSLVAALAAANCAVRATGRRAGDPRLHSDGVTFVPADLIERDAPERLCDGTDAVFHAAALSASWGRLSSFQEINVSATERLLEAAQKAGVKRFIYVSSPSIYAAARDRLGLTEDDAPADPPLNAYARTKLEAERLVLAAGRPGFATVSVRPRAIVGPDDRVLAPRLIELASRGRAPMLRGGRAMIELTDVLDVVDALIACEANAEKLCGQAINISGGRPVSVREIAQSLAAKLGVELRLVPIPMVLANGLATLSERPKPETGAEPLLTRYSLATLAFSQTFDLSKARAALGYAPRRDGLETLLAFVQSVRR